MLLAVVDVSVAAVFVGVDDTFVAVGVVAFVDIYNTWYVDVHD